MSTTMPEVKAESSGRVFTCGTLKYTVYGLFSLFFWLLWGDFFWQLLNTAIPGILPLKLNEMGASDTSMSMLVRTMGTGIAFVLCPIVSFKSDRYRSRWGRRIPFLAWSTPVVGLFMILMGCYEDVTQFMIGDAQKATIFGFEMSRMGVSLVIFGVLLVGFDVFDIYNDTIYYYLFNDVVPPQFLARFLALFRMVGAAAGMAYNYFIMEHSLTHFRMVWVLGGIGYTVAYLMMCFFVKEGQYPPPPENVDKGSGFISSLKTYFKECFYHPFYWCFFLLNTFFAVSWVAGGLFGTLRNTGSLELSLKELGMMGVYLTPISIVLMYPAAWLADKFNPVRVYFWVTLICILSNATNVVFVFTDFGPRINLIFLYIISIVFMPFSALQGAAELPMYMRLLPKERYGQFCSANGGLRAFANIFFSIIAGLVITWIGNRMADGYSVATNEISVVGTPSAAAQWREEKAGPWEVKYLDNDARKGTITVPGATAVKVYFSEIRTEYGWDHLLSDGQAVDDWSGNFDETYSSARQGDSITLSVRSNMTGPGSFIVTKVAYLGEKTGDIARTGLLWSSGDDVFSLGGTIEDGDKAGVAGATVSFGVAEGGGGVPEPVVTDALGNWSQNGFAKGSRYTISAKKDVIGGTWKFAAPAEAFAAARAGIRFAGTYEEAGQWAEETIEPAWVIKYQNNWDRTGTVTVPGASAVRLYYEVFKTVPGVDSLVTDAPGDVPRSGNLGALLSEAKSGDTIGVRLSSGMYGKLASNMRPRRSGNLYNDYEIRVTKVRYQGSKTGQVSREGKIWEDARATTFPLSGQVRDGDGSPIAGAVVSFRTLDGQHAAPEPVRSDVRGHWCQTGFGRGGKYGVDVSAAGIGEGWTFSRPTVGDMKYRYYPVWAMFFHVGAITCLVLLYRGWKARGGADGYTPPVLEGDVAFPPATPIVGLFVGFSLGLAGLAGWLPGKWMLDVVVPSAGWTVFVACVAWLVTWWFTRKRKTAV